MTRAAVVLLTRVFPLPPFSALLTTDIETPASFAMSASPTAERVRGSEMDGANVIGNDGFLVSEPVGPIVRSSQT